MRRTRRWSARSPSGDLWWPYRYALALAGLAAASGAALLLRPFLTEAVYLPFSAAVVVVAWLGGLGPALVVTVLAMAATELLRPPPAEGIELLGPPGLVALGVFLLIAVVVSWLGAKARRSMAALEQRERERERYSEELEARRTDAEWHLERSRLLSAAAMQLTASLGYEENLEALARLAVPHLADYCVTYRLEEDGEIRRAGVAHADPAQEPLVHRLLDLAPPTLEDAYGAGAVLRTGEPVMAREISDELLERATQGPAHLETIRALRPLSSLIVPLRARGHPVGAMAWATTPHSGRRYEERDLTVALELAAHAGLAVDNARLFRRSQAEIAERRRVQATLETRERQLVDLLDHAPDIIARFDRQFRYVYVNPAVEEIADVPPESMVGRTNRELRMHPRSVAEIEGAVARAFESAVGHSAEFIVPLEGGERWFHARLVPERAGDGSVATVLCIARDVTERRAAERRRELLVEASRILTASLDYEVTLRNLAGLIVRTLGDGCAISAVSEGGRVARVEVAAREPWIEERMRWIVDRYPTELDDPDHPVSRVLRTGESVFVPRVQDALVEAVSQDAEHRRLFRELNLRSLIVVPLAGRGHVAGAISVVRMGTSPPFRAEDVHVLEELSLQAGLALDNARLYREVKEAMRLREEMMAFVAHDLRDPLGVIAAVASGLERTEDAEERARLLAMLGRQTDRAAQLIQDLLDLSRIEAGRFSVEPAPVSASELLAEACAAARLKGRARGLSVQWRNGQTAAEVAADRSRVLQVLGNLVDNALNAARREIEIRVEEEREMVRFAVSDDGPGIPESELPRLFERFWQGRGREGAAGLGLAIVKGIVEAHGGSVWVESLEGGGTTVFFTVPRAEATRSAAAAR